jgi:hypothetical protein
VPKQQVKFRMKGVTKMQLDYHLFSTNLLGEPPKADLICVCGCTNGELSAELLRKRLLQSYGGLVVEFSVVLNDSIRTGNLLLGQRLHADQKAAAFAVTSRPLFDVFIELSPTSQVKIADAEVRPVGYGKRRSQSWQ